MAFCPGQPRKATIASTLFRDKLDSRSAHEASGQRCTRSRASLSVDRIIGLDRLLQNVGTVASSAAWPV